MVLRDNNEIHVVRSTNNVAVGSPTAQVARLADVLTSSLVPLSRFTRHLSDLDALSVADGEAEVLMGRSISPAVDPVRI